MSIQDEAARVMGNVHANPMKSSRPPVIAEALADAGLLASELPEANDPNATEVAHRCAHRHVTAWQAEDTTHTEENMNV